MEVASLWLGYGVAGNGEARLWVMGDDGYAMQFVLFWVAKITCIFCVLMVLW